MTYQPTRNEIADARTEAAMYAEGTPLTQDWLIREWRIACDNAGEHVSPQRVYEPIVWDYERQLLITEVVAADLESPEQVADLVLDAHSRGGIAAGRAQLAECQRIG